MTFFIVAVRLQPGYVTVLRIGIMPRWQDDMASNMAALPHWHDDMADTCVNFLLVHMPFSYWSMCHFSTGPRVIFLTVHVSFFTGPRVIFLLVYVSFPNWSTCHFPICPRCFANGPRVFSQ
jgi:hypothetical protein